MQRLIIIGDIEPLKDFDDIFSSDGKFLISRTYGRDWFFEMSGESMYYDLTYEEHKNNISLREYKNRIVKAIHERLYAGQGQLLHKSFSGENDTQFRSTNSAIRTLLEARNDGFEIDDDLSKIIKHHFSYYFKWLDGIWFCHDSSEFEGKGPWSHIRTRCLGKDWRNTLTLNTHIDSINTLFLLKKNMFDIDGNVEDLLRKSLQSINQIVSIKTNSINHLLQKIDNIFLDRYVERVSEKNEWYLSFYERIVHPVIFKILTPTLFFENGFIARDLSVLNRHLDYMLVNIVDLSRMLCLYNEMYEQSNITSLAYDEIWNRIKKGINWVESHPNFVKLVSMNPLMSAWYAEMYFALSNLEIDLYDFLIL